MLLEDFLEPKPLRRSRHDDLIEMISSGNEINPNVLTIMTCAYYNEKLNGGCRVEGDIDLLQLFYDHEKYDLFDYKEVPFNDATLLLFEVKSNDTSKGYKKAISQLKKSKDLVLSLSDYYKVDCFYGFGMGKKSNGYVWRFEQV